MSTFTMNTADIHNRQALIEEIGIKGNEKLKKAHVAIIGAGGLGHPAIQYLIASGIGHISIFDHDIVSASNLNRQILFRVEDIGRLKVEVVKERLQNLNPHCKIDIYPYRFETICIQKKMNALINCSDNLNSKFNAHDFAYHKNVFYVQASVHKLEGQLQVFDFEEKGENSPCLRCLYPVTPNDPNLTTCSENGILGVTTGILGVMQANEVIKKICGISNLKNGETYNFDLKTYQSQTMRWKKNNDCILCAAKKERKFDPFSDDQNETEIEISSDSNLYLNSEKINIKDNPNDLTERISNIASTKDIVLICDFGSRSFKMALELRTTLSRNNIYSLKHGLNGISPNVKN